MTTKGIRAALAAVALQASISPSAFPAELPTIDADSLRQDTKYLSSDELDGRLPGTAGDDKAVAYMIKRMDQIGLKPGYHGRWTQDVPLVTITPAADTSLQIDGAREPLHFRQRTEAIIWTKRPQPTVSLSKSELVFVGYGIVAPERGWNDYAGVDAKGKTVIILVNDPDWQSKTTTGLFDGRRLTYYGRYTYKFEEAARQGAAAAFVIHQTEAAGYPFQVLVNTNAGAKVSIDSSASAGEHASVEGWLSTPAAERLFEAAGLSLSELTAAAQKPDFKAVSMKLQASTTLSNTVAHSTSQNVIGTLPGKEHPDEAFLYSAHWDHLGDCAPNAAGHAVCNGAVDNASGSAGLLALAKAFAQQPRPSRSILFVSLTGEEQGMLGSEYYVRSPALPIAKTTGGINIDVMNVFGPTRDVMVLHPGLTSLEPLFVEAAKSQGRTLSPEMLPEQGLYYRSDQLSFARAGIPMLFASSGFDRGPSVPPTLGLAGYFQHVYHTASDVFDPNWDWSGAVQDLQIYYAVGSSVARSADWPTWAAASEFHRRGSSEQAKQ